MIGLVFGLAGCATYVLAPMDGAALVAARSIETLEPAHVRASLAEIAPGVEWGGNAWDRLVLFAAARRYSPDVAAARLAVETAVAAARAARVAPAATLTLTSEYAVAATESSPWLFGAALDIPVDRGARRQARLTSADLAIALARYDYADALWRARMGVRRAVAERLIAERRMVAFQDLADLRVRQQAAMERRLAAGEVSRAELERVRADGADAVRLLLDAGAQARAASGALAAAVGLAPVAFGSIAPSWVGFDTPVSDPGADVTREQRLAAVLSRSDVLRAVAAYDQAEADLKLETARQYPVLSVGPGYTWERGLVKLPLSVGLVLPPLDLNRAAIATAQAHRAEAGRRLEAAVAGVEAEIDAALIETAAARIALDRIRRTDLPAAARLADQAERELGRGAIDRAEWAAAVVGARQVRTTELDALARVHAADAALEGALRRPLEGPETVVAPSNSRTAP
ncbi:TolC family protein [Phenylobacterium sp.]|uniref:TolC family protein n=1 Tax=Phenylobacterium sp. TaxID=1871053 RepID=UPI0039836475